MRKFESRRPLYGLIMSIRDKMQLADIEDDKMLCEVCYKNYANTMGCTADGVKYRLCLKCKNIKRNVEKALESLNEDVS